MQVSVNLSDAEKEILLSLLGYTDEVEVTIVNEDGEEVYESIPNPVTKEQFLLDTFEKHKRDFLRQAVSEKIKIIAEKTKKKLLESSEIVLAEVEQQGLENLEAILKSQI